MLISELLKKLTPIKNEYFSFADFLSYVQANKTDSLESEDDELYITPFYVDERGTYELHRYELVITREAQLDDGKTTLLAKADDIYEFSKRDSECAEKHSRSGYRTFSAVAPNGIDTDYIKALYYYLSETKSVAEEIEYVFRNSESFCFDKNNFCFECN